MKNMVKLILCLVLIYSPFLLSGCSGGGYGMSIHHGYHWSSHRYNYHHSRPPAYRPSPPKPPAARPPKPGHLPARPR